MALSKKSNNNSNSVYNKPSYVNKSNVPMALIGGLGLGGLAATSKAMELAKRAKDLRDRANWTNMKKKYYDEEKAKQQKQRESDDLLNKDKAEAIKRAQTQWQQNATALANERNTNRAEGLARGTSEAKEKALRSSVPDTSGLYKPGTYAAMQHQKQNTALANERNTNRAEGLARGSAEAARRAQTQWQQDATALANEYNTNRAEGLARGASEATKRARLQKEEEREAEESKLRSDAAEVIRQQKQRESDDLLNRDKAEAIKRAAANERRGDIKLFHLVSRNDEGDISPSYRNSIHVKANKVSQSQPTQNVSVDQPPHNPPKPSQGQQDDKTNINPPSEGMNWGTAAKWGLGAVAAAAIGYGGYKLIKHLVSKYKNKIINSKDSPQAKRAAINSIINDINVKISKATTEEEKNNLMRARAELQNSLSQIR